MVTETGKDAPAGQGGEVEIAGPSQEGVTLPECEGEAEKKEAVAAEKVEEVEKELSVEELKAKFEEETKVLRERMLRIAADFDNYKKRMAKEIAEREERAKIEALSIILPTIDNLRRAALHIAGATDLDAIKRGISMVEAQLMEALAKAGVRPVETEGAIFDPYFHEAVAKQPSKEAPGTILSELQRGYMLGNKLIRPALVIVSEGMGVEETPQIGNGDGGEKEEGPQQEEHGEEECEVARMEDAN